MLHMDPHQRYTTEQVLKHSWITHRDQLANDQPNKNDTSHVIKVKHAFMYLPNARYLIKPLHAIS